MLNINTFACTGCSACYAVCPTRAIRMRPDGEGFLHPTIDEAACILCGACERTCPALSKERKGILPAAEPLFVAAARACGEGAREGSQSGGAFFALAKAMLAEGGVVYGARMDEDKTVRHARVDGQAALDPLRGSKYVQSDMGDCFLHVKQDLAAGHRVLFSGTPCQVAGLYAFLGREYENLLTAALICHGVPSPRLWADYLAWQEKRHKKPVTRAEFRDLSASWGVSREALWLGDKKVTDTVYAALYYSCLALREACYTCPFGKEFAVADLTLGDFWGVEHTPYAAPDDKKGVSAVLAHTEKGREALLAADLSLCPATLAEVKEKNPNLTAPTARPQGREAFWAAYTRGFGSLPRRFGGFTPKNRLKRLVKRLLGRD